MLMTPYSRIVTAAITLVTAALQLGVTSVVSAQINNDNWCANSQFDNLDATASYSVPGFTYPGDNNASSISINSTWTFSTGAVNFPNDYRNPVQRIWVDTSPVVQIDSDSLPYQGCVLFLLSLTNKVAPEGSQDKNGDCKSVLGEECVNSILKNVTAIAQSIPARTEEDFRRFNQSDSLNYSFEYGQCRGYFVGAAFPDVCGPADDLYIGVGAFIGGHPRIFINETLATKSFLGELPSCPNVGNGTAAASPLTELPRYSDTYVYPFDSAGLRDYRTYDQWLNHSLPVLVPVWSKDPKKAWGDSRLVCMRPEEIRAQPSSGVRNVGYDLGRVIGLSFITALLLMVNR